MLRESRNRRQYRLRESSGEYPLEFRLGLDLSAFPSFNFPCLRESGTTVLSDTTAPDGGGTRECTGGAVVGCLTLPPSGRGGDVPLCRRRAGEGLFHSPAVRRGTGRPLRRRPETSARQSVFWGGRFRPASPTPPRRRGVPFSALLPVGFAGGFPSAGLPAAGNDSFSKLS